MKRASVVLILLVSCTSPLQSGVFLQGTFDVPEELVTRSVPVDEIRYLLRFPDGYQQGDDVPLVVFLHGSGDDDYDSRWLTSYGLPAVLLFDEPPTHQPFVLLAPQAVPGTSWDRGRQPETVMALVDHVLDAYGLDPDRVSLTGLSMGGYGSWHLATRFPDRFATVASLSGSGYGTTALPEDLDVCVLAGVDLRGYHGANDLVSLPELNVMVIEAWEQRCGAVLDFRVLDDAGHFETFDRVYRDGDFYDWLLKD
jgi:predicted peptidase